MKQCKCEHWQTCPSCYPQGFDAEGARLPPQPTPLEAAKKQIAQLEQALQSTADVLGGKDFELQNVIRRNKELELCIARHADEKYALNKELTTLKKCLFQAQEAVEAECEANEKLELALQNCRLFAARNRNEGWALLILRFCAGGGVAGCVTR